MERREFLGTTVGGLAMFGTQKSFGNSLAQNVITTKDDKKNIVSLLQSDYVSGPPESNQFHPKFDVDKLENLVFNKNIDNICNLLETAGQRGSDIACTTEDIKGMYGTMMNFDRPELFINNCETIPGKLTDRFGAIAKKYEMYIIACFFEKDHDTYYNTAVLIDRKGRIQGKYHKIQLPSPETWVLKAGNEFPVFDTDIGRIGIEICYDMIFPEITQCIALNGIDIIFHPTGGFGWTEDLGINTIKVRAADHNIWIAVAKSATLHGPGRSCVVNPLGQVVADAGYELNSVLTSYISPKESWVQPDFGFGTAITGVADMRARLNLERRPEIYKEIINSHPPILDRYPNAKLISSKGKEAQKEVVEKLKKQWVKEAIDTEPKIGLVRGIL